MVCPITQGDHNNKVKAKKCEQDSTRCAHCSVMYGDLIREEEITGCNAWGARPGSMRPAHKYWKYQKKQNLTAETVCDSTMLPGLRHANGGPYAKVLKTAPQRIIIMYMQLQLL